MIKFNFCSFIPYTGKTAGFYLSFTILLYSWSAAKTIPERQVNCSNLWDLLWQLLNGASWL
jgi:hypothetical protein